MATGYLHKPTYDSGFLQVSDVHKLYYEQYGKQDGKPVIFLHGGPGLGTTPKNTEFFNPAIYRVVLLDQRGSGKSLPSAELQDNTSRHLVADLETLRVHLQIPKWHMVFGGSWGSALGLMYAQAHPEAVGSLVLRGIFTGRQEELDFPRGHAGAAMLFPEAFEAYVSHLPPWDRHAPERGYYNLLLHQDSGVRDAAVRQIDRFDSIICEMHWHGDTAEQPGYVDSYAEKLIECHYCCNDLFIEPGSLLKKENVDRIRHIPATLVQGRFDLLCPPKTAWDLHRQWPESKLWMIPDAGHLSSEPGTKAKLIETCDEYATLDLI